MVLFHLSPFKDFKHFWHYGVEQKYRNYFGDIPSYGRFVSLMPRLFIPFCVLMHSLTGDQTGLYVADSTKIAVCHNLRISRNRVFADLAKRGKTTTGWFYGFKLHVIINHKGEIMAIKITPGNTDDRSVLDDMTRELEGKVLADKGYISKELFAKLWRRSIVWQPRNRSVRQCVAVQATTDRRSWEHPCLQDDCCSRHSIFLPVQDTGHNRPAVQVAGV